MTTLLGKHLSLALALICAICPASFARITRARRPRIGGGTENVAVPNEVADGVGDAHLLKFFRHQCERFAGAVINSLTPHAFVSGMNQLHAVELLSAWSRI